MDKERFAIILVTVLALLLLAIRGSYYLSNVSGEANSVSYAIISESGENH